jgi:hypothetical protein
MYMKHMYLWYDMHFAQLIMLLDETWALGSLANVSANETSNNLPEAPCFWKIP